MKNGTPLLQFRRFAGLVALNLPEINSRLMRDLLTNSDALALILKESLSRDKFNEALIELKKIKNSASTSHYAILLDGDRDPPLQFEQCGELQGYTLKGEGTQHRRHGRIRLEYRDDQLFIDGREVSRLQARGRGNPRSQGTGEDLYARVQNEYLLNGCIWEFLLAHPEFIPTDWKKGYTSFYGTVLRSTEKRDETSIYKDGLYVPTLTFEEQEGTWHGYYAWKTLSNDNDFVAVL
jgi:hypothetical protein